MGNSQLSTVREALLAELLQEADALVRRFEEVNETLENRIERATTDAAGKAFLVAKLNFETMVDKNADKLTEAGRRATAEIGSQLNLRTAQFLTWHGARERKLRQMLLLMIGCALVAGSVGGVVGAKLAGL